MPRYSSYCRVRSSLRRLHEFTAKGPDNRRHAWPTKQILRPSSAHHLPHRLWPVILQWRPESSMYHLTLKTGEIKVELGVWFLESKNFPQQDRKCICIHRQIVWLALENLRRHVPQSAYDTGRLVRSIGSHVVVIKFLGQANVENFHVAPDIECAILGFLFICNTRQRIRISCEDNETVVPSFMEGNACTHQISVGNAHRMKITQSACNIIGYHNPFHP